MAINMITGYAGYDHVTSAQVGIGNAGIYGTGRYVLDVLEGLEYELISNNLIRIKSGMILNQGRFMGIDHNDYVDIEIDNGENGKKRCDLIVCTYSKNVENGIESVELKNIKGVSGTEYVTPTYETGSIINDEVLDDFPLYKVNINGLTAESVEKMFTLSNNTKGVESDLNSLSSELTSLNDNVTSLIPRITSLEDKNAVKLFEGAVAPKENETVTLKESMNNYKLLVFLLGPGSNDTPFGFALYPVIDQSQIPGFGGQSPLFSNAPPITEKNNITLYSGRFKNISETQIQIIYPIRNIVLTSGAAVGGGTQYYLRQIWGIR